MLTKVVTEQDLISIRQAIAKLSSLKLGPNSTPTFAGMGLTGVLGVSDGGSGASSLANHGLLLGSGTSAITALAGASNGQIPIGFTGNDPVLATLTGTANQLTVTNGAGSITLSLDSAITEDILEEAKRYALIGEWV